MCGSLPLKISVLHSRDKMANRITFRKVFSFILQNQYRHKADKSHWDLTTPPGAPQRTSWGSKSGRGSWPPGPAPRRMTTWPLCCWCSHWWRGGFCLSPETLRMTIQHFRLRLFQLKRFKCVVLSFLAADWYGCSEKFKNVQTFSMACIHTCAGCQSMHVLWAENCLNSAISN